ncbi:hypothetical protein FA95DRAFT_1614404 [Auriscalpium vulgare]|uniref:Uncharacterized protein n=1 Tax=Auriscalpium vulgare TaxID=40419 RepID=A0ACB8QZJ9_9AGAM|nr:hypothetical protein FA95DRAFT_1614404 [Auriscalpium vulgare]
MIGQASSFKVCDINASFCAYDVAESLSKSSRFYLTDKLNAISRTLPASFPIALFQQLCHASLSNVSFEQFDDLSLLIDIYLPDIEHLPSEPVPAILYFHGGGLTVGDRTSWFPTWLASKHASPLDS